MTIRAIAPATVANLGTGFDVLGMALHGPFVTIGLEFGDAEGEQILIECNRPEISTDPHRNTAGAAVLALQAESGRSEDLVMTISADVPIGSGLGSSAASAVAAVVAANRLLETKRSLEELLPFAVAGESVASGSPHADNVAPALFGGLTLIRSHQPADIVQLPVPADLHYVVVHPSCKIKTADARASLPDDIPLHEAAQQWGQVGAFVAALYTGDLALLGRAMRDELIEPIRGAMIPGYPQVRAAACDAGAIGCAIAGSGPAMVSLVKAAAMDQVGCAMRDAFAQAGLSSQMWSGAVGAPGAALEE
jgi:homoserine kinase